jgi:general nucleoside transport system permease protein
VSATATAMRAADPVAASSGGHGGRYRRRMVAGLETVAIYAVSLAAALAISGLLVSLTGGSATSVLSAILDGSLRGPGRWGVTLIRAAPLLVVAIGTIIAGRAGLTNIGQEGQVLVGAAFAAFVAVRLPGPGPLVLVLTIGCAIGAGAVWAGIAALLRFTRQVPEVITTLLLIFVANQLVVYGLTRQWLLADRDPERTSRVDTGELLRADTRLPGVTVFGNSVDLSVLIALLLAFAVAVFIARTVWGYRLRVLGESAAAAQRSGVSAKGVGSLALIVSGAFAGLAGGMLLTGGASSSRLTVGFSNNVGWEGLLVALLARNRPLVAIPMAFVFAILRTGSGFLAATGVDRRIVDVVQALLVLALLIPPAVQFLRERRRQLAAATASG